MSEMTIGEVCLAARNSIAALSESEWPADQALAERLGKLVAELGAMGELLVRDAP